MVVLVGYLYVLMTRIQDALGLRQRLYSKSLGSFQAKVSWEHSTSE